MIWSGIIMKECETEKLHFHFFTQKNNANFCFLYFDLLYHLRMIILRSKYRQQESELLFWDSIMWTWNWHIFVIKSIISKIYTKINYNILSYDFIWHYDTMVALMGFKMSQSDRIGEGFSDDPNEYSKNKGVWKVGFILKPSISEIVKNRDICTIGELNWYIIISRQKLSLISMTGPLKLPGKYLVWVGRREI